jgi:diguanylate cyclase (GGDEF)-like protein/PAS domain S-box-containing protein
VEPAFVELDVSESLSLVAVSGDIDRLLGVSAGDILREPGFLLTCLHPADAATLGAWCHARLIPDEPAPYLRLRHADGAYRIFHARSVNPGARTGCQLRVVLQEASEQPSQLPEIASPMISVLLETTDDFIFFKGVDHLFVAASRSMVAICKPAESRFDFIGQSDYFMFPEPLADRYYELEQQVYAGAEIAQEVQPFFRPDGSPGWVDNRKYPIRNTSGRLIGLYGVARDITDQVLAARARAISSSVFEATSEGIVVFDERGHIIDANAAFVHASGQFKEDILGKSIADLKHSAKDADDFRIHWRQLIARGHWEGEVSNADARGVRRSEYVKLNAVTDQGGKAQYYVGIYTDVTALKLHEAELDDAAHMDSLTGLPNRRLLLDRLRQALALCKRTGNQVAVCFVDLDGFKAVNDSLGHACGDAVLIQYARRASAVLRDGDTLARLGGDEFVALLSNIKSDLEARIIIERLIDIGRQPFQIQDKSVSLSTSVGVVLGPRDGYRPELLLRKADRAMYEAKGLGKDAFLFFDDLLEESFKTPG